jgi:hypothetical protein
LGCGFCHGEESVIYLVIESNSFPACSIEHTIKRKEKKTEHHRASVENYHRNKNMHKQQQDRKEMTK